MADSTIFTDSIKLENRNFGWGLSAYPGDDAEPGTDAPSMALFVDEEGVANISGPLLLHLTAGPADPIDSVEIPTFSPGNLFIEGVRKAIPPFPLYGVMAFPTRSVQRDEATNAITSIAIGGLGEENRFPDDTPAGFVPCVGQFLTYPDGRKVQVPNLGPRTVLDGDGGQSVTSSAPLGMVWMMKVEEGWETMVPDVSGQGMVQWAGAQ